MRIGVTYDLRSDYLAMGYGEEETAEFDSEITIAAICAALDRHGPDAGAHRRREEPDRAAGEGRALGRGVQFLRRARGIAREAQVPAMLEAYDIPYVFSDPLTMALSLDKGMASAWCAMPGCRRPISASSRSSRM